MDDKALREAIRREWAYTVPKKDLIGRIEELEAKLAKAVETISLCRKMQAQFAHTEDPFMVLLDTTIAELKGL